MPEYFESTELKKQFTELSFDADGSVTMGPLIVRIAGDPPVALNNSNDRSNVSD